MPGSKTGSGRSKPEEPIKFIGSAALSIAFSPDGKYLAAGCTDEAIQLGLRASAMEPLRESPHRLVIRCHLAEGNLVEAVRQYDRYAALMERELGASPSPHMRVLLPVVPGSDDRARPHAADAAGRRHPVAAGW